MPKPDVAKAGIGEYVRTAIDTVWTYATDKILLNPKVCEKVDKFYTPLRRMESLTYLGNSYINLLKEEIEKEGNKLKKKYLTGVSGHTLKERKQIIETSLCQEYKTRLNDLQGLFYNLKEDLSKKKIVDGLSFDFIPTPNIKNTEGKITPGGLFTGLVVAISAGTGAYIALDKAANHDNQKKVYDNSSQNNATQNNDTIFPTVAPTPDMQIGNGSDNHAKSNVSNNSKYLSFLKLQDVQDGVPFLKGKQNLTVEWQLKQPMNDTDQMSMLLQNFGEYLRQGGVYDREKVWKIIDIGNVSVSTENNLTNYRNYSNADTYGVKTSVTFDKVRKRDLSNFSVLTVPWMDAREIDFGKYPKDLGECTSKNPLVQGVEFIPMNDTENLVSLTDLPQQLNAGGLLFQNLPPDAMNGAVWTNYSQKLFSNSSGRYMAWSSEPGVAKCLAGKLMEKGGSSGKGGTIFSSSSESSSGGDSGGGSDGDGSVDEGSNDDGNGGPGGAK